MPFDEPTVTTIDGVPVWWTDVGGPCQGGVVFRTGRADEPLRDAGISHIVEHLALAPMMYRGFDMNGRVNALTTMFYVNGTQAQVEAFLTEVCTNITALPTNRLTQERRVIETEARSHGGNFAGSASARYGARGFGAADWIELGLHHLGEDDVAAWAAERFTAAQAAAWMTRPPSPALRFPLAPGTKLPIPVPEPLPGLVLPSHVHGSGGVLGCSYTAKRSLPLFIATMLVEERAMSSLRGEHGLTYSVRRGEERIGALDVFVMLSLDATDEAMPEAVRRFTDLLRAVGDGDMTPEEVARVHVASMPWNATDPARPSREAFRKATASLFDREPTPWKGLAAQGERLTVDEVAAAMDEALGTAILVAPEEQEVPDPYKPHPTPPPDRPEIVGRLYGRWDGSDHEELVVGDDGISSHAGTEPMAMLFDDIEVVLRHADGSMWLIDARGDGMYVVPNQLLRGRVLAHRIEERLGDRLIDMGPDVEGWFELQTVVESHDASAIRSVWREIEILASEREPEERVLAIAIGDVDGDRGLVVATDRRQLHICATRQPHVYWIEREKIRRVVASVGFFGRRLVIIMVDGSVQIDRIRPRAAAAELERLLTPIDDDET